MKSIIIRKVPDEIMQWYASQAEKVGMGLETYIRFILIETARKEQTRTRKDNQKQEA